VNQVLSKAETWQSNIVGQIMTLDGCLNWPPIWLDVALRSSFLGTVAGVRAAKAATTTIPKVFRTGGDPVDLGLVASLNQPGGNITGVNGLSLETGTKRLGLLHELLPHSSRVVVLINPNDPNAEHYAKGLEAAASTVGQQVKFFNASNIRDIDLAFAAVTEWQPDAILVVAQGLFFNRRVQIVTQATFHALPGMYPDSDFVDIGG